MEALVYSTRYGPTIAFLPPRKGSIPEHAAIPADQETLRTGYAMAASRGMRASWNQHCELLTKLSNPYAGRWYRITVPDGSTARFALGLARSQAVDEAVDQPQEAVA